MSTPKKVIGAAVAIAVGLALKGCASTHTQVYGPKNYTSGEPLVLCSGFNTYTGLSSCRAFSGCKSYNGCGASGCKGFSSCGSSGCQTFTTRYVAVNNDGVPANSCSSANGCNNKYTFHKNNNVKCRIVGFRP